MILSSSPRCLRSALSFALVMLLALLLVPAGALAQARRTASPAHKAACASSPTTHATHSARACAQSTHKGKAPARHSGRRHAKRPVKKTTSTPPAPASDVPASCADASAPLRAKDGSFSCADGSEPACAEGSSPTPAIGDAPLLCPANPKPGSESGCEDVSNSECAFPTFGDSSAGQAACEDAGRPISAPGGSSACGETSEPD